jgi:protein SCO1/2
MKYRVVIVAAALAAVAAGTAAQEIQAPAFDAGTALRVSQAAIGRRLPPDIALTDASGTRRSLGDFRGRPLIVSPVYTSCFGICPTTTTSLRKVVEILESVVGPDAFAVLTIGFDTANDTPGRMRDFAASRGPFPSNWTFAAAGPAEARRLLDGIGFTYVASPRGFDHMIQATILDAEGVVVRQVYGQDFDPPLLVEPMKRLAIGQQAGEDTFGAMIEGVRLFCTVFDPKSGRYRFDWSIVLSALIGVLCFTAVAMFLWRSWSRAR